MTKITFIESDGTTHEVNAENGQSLMAAAIGNMVPGIDADCGGSCMCATCHIILDSDGYALVGEPHADERGMLGLTPEPSPTSRLACQIEVSDALEGLVVRLPEFQM
ncbi:MAG: 2Fe-2S iron-sulfur cluster-binding protein [Porticoccaceae bacterium]